VQRENSYTVEVLGQSRTFKVFYLIKDLISVKVKGCCSDMFMTLLRFFRQVPRYCLKYAVNCSLTVPVRRTHNSALMPKTI
jgi:hypothetical protein